MKVKEGGLKIVFFGTPEFVLPVLNTLHKHFSKKSISSIAAVVTQKPRPAGRKKMLAYSPVDTWAHKKGIPILFDPGQLIEGSISTDIGVLAAYGEIVEKKVIDWFPHKIVNIHPSLLPQFRGASPVPAAILAGEKQTGVSFIKMNEKLDGGDIISSFSENILNNDTSQTLLNRLFERSASVLPPLLEAYIQGKINIKKQSESKATMTRKLSKEDGFIVPELFENAVDGKALSNYTWSFPFFPGFSIKNPKPEDVERVIRAMHPWPGTWTYIKRKNKQLRLKIIDAELKEGKLLPTNVQLEGKNITPWKQFKWMSDTSNN